MKININDVTKGFFVVNFHHFANIKKTININKGFHIFNLKIYIFFKWHNSTMDFRTCKQNIGNILINNVLKNKLKFLKILEIMS
jgi:hypothetical protein